MKTTWEMVMALTFGLMLLAFPIYFSYNLTEKVTNPLGQVGVVQELGFDSGGVKYMVQTVSGPQWWRDPDLRKAPK